jgi:hypothetical protein
VRCKLNQVEIQRVRHTAAASLPAFKLEELKMHTTICMYSCPRASHVFLAALTRGMQQSQSHFALFILSSSSSNSKQQLTRHLLYIAAACNSLASRIPRNQARSPFKNISLSFIGNVNRLSANQPAFDDDEEICGSSITVYHFQEFSGFLSRRNAKKANAVEGDVRHKRAVDLKFLSLLGLLTIYTQPLFTGSIIVSKNLNEKTLHVTLELFVDAISAVNVY